MRIGVPREIKTLEYRVGLTPDSVRELTAAGHETLVETQAGAGIGADDDAYRAAGAHIAPTAQDVFAAADLIVKVKEPQRSEWESLRPGQILFTYLHLAIDPDQARGLIQSGAAAIAYETVREPSGAMPLLAPMSEIAGRLAAEAAAQCLRAHVGGRGVLMGGAPGTPPARVAVLGGGVVGAQAARMALGLGAEVAVLDKSLPRLRQLDDLFQGRLRTRFSTAAAIEEEVAAADAIIGAVLIPGATAPKLVDRALLKRLRPGAAMVDVAIDQGGCFATSRPTTWAAPTFVEEGMVHFCVTNMPGAAPVTASRSLNNATLPFVLELAAKGEAALDANPALAAGVNVRDGRIVHPAVAQSLGFSQ